MAEEPNDPGDHHSESADPGGEHDAETIDQDATHIGQDAKDNHRGESSRDPAYGFRDPDALIARAGVRGNPDADQHFLVDDRVLDRLPGYATEAGFDVSRILEIGGGTGVLTDRLLEVGQEVIVIERDSRLATFLREEFAAACDTGRLTVIDGDALEVPLPEFTTSVSNLPYSISSAVIFRLLPTGMPFVVTVQREFAERMVASPGSDAYGRLSVTARYYADVELVEVVPPAAFEPAPAVESAVVRATPRTPDYDIPDERFFMNLLRAVFTQRRKTMRNAIRNTGHMSGLGDTDAVVGAIDEDLLEQRAGSLSPGEFAHIATVAWEVGDPGEPDA